MIDMNVYAVGTKLLASVGKKKKSRIVEILITEWSPSGNHFRAEIRDGVKITFGWVSSGAYNVVELITNPMVDIKNSIESAYKTSYEQQLADASAEKLTTKAANAVNTIVEYFPEDRQEAIRDTIFKLRSVKDLNRICEYNGLMADLQEDMISEFSSIWSKLLPKKSSTGIGVPVGVLTGRPSPLAPKDGFVDIAKPAETPVAKESDDIRGGGEACYDTIQMPINVEQPESKMSVMQKDCVGEPHVSSDMESMMDGMMNEMMGRSPSLDVTPADGQPKVVREVTDTLFGKMVTYKQVESDGVKSVSMDVNQQMEVLGGLFGGAFDNNRKPETSQETPVEPTENTDTD
jgi:hypothetical protein